MAESHGSWPEREKEILAFWEKHSIFKKSLSKKAPKGNFVFFEGPPTANGKPGIHHAEARAFKDLIPRFRTMQGYKVERKGGWDTHGLPVELEVEKQLGFKSKGQIEEYGIAKFNEKCKESVWKYLEDWKEFTRRLGFWVDLEDPYVTYHPEYVESLWWVIKQIWDKGLLYQDYRVTPHCPRCGTSLSSHELALGYKEVEDPAVYVKFKVKGKKDEYLIAWTTTPWTLPGNVALAVNPDVDYVKVKVFGSTQTPKEGEELPPLKEEILIIAADRKRILDPLFHPKNIQILGHYKGSELVGMKYEQLYPFWEDTIQLGELYQTKKTKGEYKVFEVLPGDFVSTEEGTGIVHTAVMYGVDDFELGNRFGIPKHHIVGLDGRFIEGTGFLEGKFVKEADKEIIKDLKSRHLLFRHETVTHSYPFCWRCKTPVIYYAKDSWYIKMSALRDKMIKENKKIHWEPEHIQEGRFGEWLREVKDWAFSRERYWGTPLPIWVCQKCGEKKCVGSFEELGVPSKPATIWTMRHGASKKNNPRIIQGNVKDSHKYGLTPEGAEQVEQSAQSLKGKIDLILSSDFGRARETAEIVQKITGAEVFFDEDLWEIQTPDWEGQLVEDIEKQLGNRIPLDLRLGGGENYLEVRERMQRAVQRALRRFPGKHILFVSHGDPLWILKWSYSSIPEADYHTTTYPQKGIAESIDVPVDFDPHRPTVDDIILKCKKCGGKAKRVPDVCDVWFDSGCMPYAQWHYPFENKEKIDPSTKLRAGKAQAYPADYISEAIDQTRGWFYTLLAVAALLGKERPYKNVICLGLVLDAKGKKMSKSLGNIVDPMEMIGKYGADAVRWYMYTVNQPGDSKRFDEKDLADIVRKNFNILLNVENFYSTYASPVIARSEATKQSHEIASASRKLGLAMTKNVLDRWILARLHKLIATATDSLENYKVTEPARDLGEFVNDLSTWWLRRSRDRFKGYPPSSPLSKGGKRGVEDTDKQTALSVLHDCLLTTTKLLAPFTPFLAEDMYRRLGGEEESVHLESWPKVEKKYVDEKLLEEMGRVRSIVSRALERRAEAGRNVRQALARMTVRLPEGKLDAAYLDLLKDEVNVKEVEVKEGEYAVELDLNLTPELVREGTIREIIRRVNAMRKNAKLSIQDRIELFIESKESEIAKALEEHRDDLLSGTLSSDLRTSGNKPANAESFRVNEFDVTVGFEKPGGAGSLPVRQAGGFAGK